MGGQDPAGRNPVQIRESIAIDGRRRTQLSVSHNSEGNKKVAGLMHMLQSTQCASETGRLGGRQRHRSRPTSSATTPDRERAPSGR